MIMQQAVSISTQQSDRFIFGTTRQYQKKCLRLADKLLASYGTVDTISQYENRINAYPHLSTLEPPRDVHMLEDEQAILHIRKIRAAKCILAGKLFTEHAAAGEATRLGLGTKYLINMGTMLNLDQISRLMSQYRNEAITAEDIVGLAGCTPKDLLPLSLGTRHMLQFSYDIYRLAREFNADPREVLARQKMLIVLNESTEETIIDEIIQYRFFGFKRENVMFMVQKAYPGICFENGMARFAPESPSRLHNHGYIMLQQTMPDQIFIVDEKRRRQFLEPYEYGDILEGMDDKITYNIEDLEFLTGAIDYEALGFALERGRKGVRMLMEIVKNDPENPQKGGMAAYDPIVRKNVMVESFQLMGIANENISYLNKNFNHYPNPYESWSIVKVFGLNMPVTVKNGYLYYQPVQGDMNFLVNTEFYQRKNIKPIRAWKSIANTPQAMHYMHLQDNQEGFRRYQAVYTSPFISDVDFPRFTVAGDNTPVLPNEEHHHHPN